MGVKFDTCEKHRGQLKGHCPQCYLEALPVKRTRTTFGRPHTRNLRELDGYAPEDELGDVDDDAVEDTAVPDVV